MKDLLSSTILPHHCCSCGKIGSILCEYCKYDIVSDMTAQCFACLRPVGRAGDICSRCLPKVSYAHAWYVGPHTGVLRELVMRYKFQRTRSASKLLAELLLGVVPQLPPDMVVTWVPTVRSHVRQRGYDHAALLATEFARLQQRQASPALARTGKTVQRGATRAERIAQAAHAFVASKVQPQPYLVIDDVSTTGASVQAAAKVLKDAGPTMVWVLTVTRDPLE